MKKAIALMLALVSLLSLSSCFIDFLGHDEKLYRTVEARIEQIISIIENKDKEEMKSLFSKKALDDTKNSDKDAESLFEPFQSGIESWDMTARRSDNERKFFKKSELIQFCFRVTTEDSVYLFYVREYNTNTIDPDNEGVSVLKMIEETEELNTTHWKERMFAGKYD
jgi:hypothetical protein